MELWVCFLEEVTSKRGGCIRWLAGEEQASRPGGDGMLSFSERGEAQRKWEGVREG